MERFPPQVIQALTAGLLGALTLVLLTIAYRVSRAGTGTRADLFLGSGSGGQGATEVNAGILRASLMGSAFSLASSIYAYINWAAIDGMFALWSPITWTVGAAILYFLRKKIYVESRKSWTLHSFLGATYKSRSLLRAASLVTTIVFLLQVAAEVFVGIAVVQVILGNGVSIVLVAAILGVIFVSYSVIGGLPAVMATDLLKYRVIALALLISSLALFDQGGYTALETIRSSFSKTFMPGSGGAWIILASLVCLNFPIFFTDMSVWQRIGAARDSREVSRGIGSYCLVLLAWLTLVVLWGVGFATFFEPPVGGTPFHGMLGFFRDSLVFPILVVGLMSALFTTADNYLISSVQTVLVDWKYYSALEAVDHDPARLTAAVHRSMLRDGRIGLAILGTVCVALALLLYLKLPSLLDLLFVVFGLQTALAAPVLAGLLGHAKPSRAPAALLSVVVGGIATIVCLGLALAGKNLAGLSIGLWTPIWALGLSSLTYVVASKISKGR